MGGKSGGLTPEQWAEVKAAYEGGEPIAALARRFGTTRNTLKAHRDAEGWTLTDHAVDQVVNDQTDGQQGGQRQISPRNEPPESDLDDDADEEDEPPSTRRNRPTGGPRGINWAGARDEYVTGDESFSEIAKRYGVSQSAVEKHASNREVNGGRTWGEWREEFRAEVSGERNELVKRIKVQAAATVSMQHATLLANLSVASREIAVAALKKCDPKDQVKLVLAIMGMERRVHGLDRAPVQVEVTGKDGNPIEHDVTIDPDVDEDARALAERSLEALFGEASEQAGT